ncbi:MAG TPA: alpha/beta hydrolase [Bryobacteraceae bacterium]|nr:alpha/beta hydrolase [Bryobacteraceae bacterium]
MPAGEGYLTTNDGVRLYFRTLGDGPKPVVIPNGIYLLDDFERLARGRTLIAYDPRNRGLSQAGDPQKLAHGIHNDVDDLEAVRRYFGIDQVDLIGHSYMGLMVILYALKHPDHVSRVVQIGAIQPNAAIEYPAHLTNNDGMVAEVFGKIAQMQREPGTDDPVELCRKFWAILRVISVADPADADRVNWGRCELPNERNFMRYWMGRILPSIQSLRLEKEVLAKVRTPVLTIHGRKDRSAPYGGACDWATQLPNARLVTVDNAAHAPWIEAPEAVFRSIEAFLDGP